MTMPKEIQEIVLAETLRRLGESPGADLRSTLSEVLGQAASTLEVLKELEGPRTAVVGKIDF